MVFSERHAAGAQDVVCGHRMKIEVWQRVGEKESLRREGQCPGTPVRSCGIVHVERLKDFNVQFLAKPAVDFVRRKRLQGRYGLTDHNLQVGERHRADQRRRSEYAGLGGLKPPYGMVPQRLDLKMEGGHVFVQPGSHEIVRIAAGFSAVPRRTVEKALNGSCGLEEGRNDEVVERCHHKGFPQGRRTRIATREINAAADRLI